MTNAVPKQAWTSMLLSAASNAGIVLPALERNAGGDPILESESRDRFVTIKRRFVPRSEAAARGVQVTLWRGRDESAVPVVAIHQPLRLDDEQAVPLAEVLHGWLVDDWSDETAISQAKKHSRDAVAIVPIAEHESER